MSSIRRFFLRLIVSWWAIPIAWIALLPVFYLGNGNLRVEVDHMLDFTKFLWNGAD